MLDGLGNGRGDPAVNSPASATGAYRTDPASTDRSSTPPTKKADTTKNVTDWVANGRATARERGSIPIRARQRPGLWDSNTATCIPRRRCRTNREALSRHAGRDQGAGSRRADFGRCRGLVQFSPGRRPAFLGAASDDEPAQVKNADRRATRKAFCSRTAAVEATSIERRRVIEWLSPILAGDWHRRFTLEGGTRCGAAAALAQGPYHRATSESYIATACPDPRMRHWSRDCPHQDCVDRIQLGADASITGRRAGRALAIFGARAWTLRRGGSRPRRTARPRSRAACSSTTTATTRRSRATACVRCRATSTTSARTRSISPVRRCACCCSTRTRRRARSTSRSARH